MEQDELIAKINRLYEHRQKLLATGNIAPDGAWIHTEITSRTIAAYLQIAEEVRRQADLSAVLLYY